MQPACCVQKMPRSPMLAGWSRQNLRCSRRLLLHGTRGSLRQVHAGLPMELAAAGKRTDGRVLPALWQANGTTTSATARACASLQMAASSRVSLPFWSGGHQASSHAVILRRSPLSRLMSPIPCAACPCRGVGEGWLGAVGGRPAALPRCRAGSDQGGGRPAGRAGDRGGC